MVKDKVKPIKCPRCGSGNTVKLFAMSKDGLAPRFNCLDCGNYWRLKKDRQG